ncbi:hypothetical protein [Bacillus sp. FSL K6-0067]|uniref:hypothetical protein n=1 Tax=Bacillus sp. FSL K6-0067 TaxID=2921412 RepID=UPI000A912C71|nr:hypothetical protein [Bacillus cereus]
MDSLTIQGNTYDLDDIKRICNTNVKAMDALEIVRFKQFTKDIYETYKQIRQRVLQNS